MRDWEIVCPHTVELKDAKLFDELLKRGARVHRQNGHRFLAATFQMDDKEPRVRSLHIRLWRN